MNRVLLVDDEESIVKLVEYNLTQAGFDVVTANDGIHALDLVKRHRPDLIILDLMLPGVSGLEVCQRLRRDQVATPIIMLTARDDEVDRVVGLEMGADDYVTKPFSPRELVARVRAVLRRSSNETTPSQPEGLFQFGSVRVDTGKYEVTVAGIQTDLTAREFELLHFLSANMGRVVSRDQLLENVWGYEFAGDTRIVDVHISHLREKLEDDPKNPQHIKTVRGVGYKLVQGDA